MPSLPLSTIVPCLVYLWIKHEVDELGSVAQPWHVEEELPVGEVLEAGEALHSELSGQ